MASAEGKNFEAITKAKQAHNSACPFPPHTVKMNPFEIERMQWEEGDTIAGSGPRGRRQHRHRERSAWSVTASTRPSSRSRRPT